MEKLWNLCLLLTMLFQMWQMATEFYFLWFFINCITDSCFHFSWYKNKCWCAWPIAYLTYTFQHHFHLHWFRTEFLAGLASYEESRRIKSWIFSHSHPQSYFFALKLVGMLSTSIAVAIKNFDISLSVCMLYAGNDCIIISCSECFSIAKAEALRLFTFFKKWKFNAVCAHAHHWKLNILKGNLTWKMQLRWFKVFQALNFQRCLFTAERIELNLIKAENHYHNRLS